MLVAGRRFVLQVAMLLTLIAPWLCAEEIPFVEATDRVTNRFAEELLVLNPKLFPYSLILPRFSAPSFEGSANFDNEGARLGELLRARLQLFDEPGRRQMNRWGMLSESQRRGIELAMRLQPYAQEMAKSDTTPVHRIGMTSDFWLRPLSGIQAHLRVRIENHGELYSQFNGRIWKEKITSWVDHGAIYAYQKGFFASVGRGSMIWGPEQRDALLFSDNAAPFDRFWIGFEKPALRFDYFFTRLDDVKYNDSLLTRYLSAHRMAFRKHGMFEFGLSEVALYGGYNRPIDWRYLNPVVPFYWEQWNRGSDDNILFGADFAIYWPKRARIFGELMIDDFQIDFVSEPHQVGYKLGIDAAAPFGLGQTFVKLSYTRVNTTVYGQNQPQNLYLYYWRPIGFFGGNDQDRMTAMFRYHLSNAIDAEIEFQYWRRGEGRIEKHQASGVPYQQKFPTGVVEKNPSLRLSLFWLDRRLIEGRLDARYNHYSNFRHQAGASEDQFELSAFLSYYIQGLLN